MQHTGIGKVCLAQHLQRILACRAGMNHHRLTRLLRRLKMNGEGRFLLLGQLGLVVIVEPGFADGYSARMLQSLE